MNEENNTGSYFKGLSKRDYILKTQEIIRSEGREAASIRRIAKEMNCSSASLYRYYGADLLCRAGAAHRLHPPPE